MKILRSVVAFVCAIVLLSGCFANPEAQEKTAELGRELLVLKADFEATVSSIDVVAQQIKALYAKQKAGELSKEDLLEALPKLVSEYKTLRVQLVGVKDRFTAAKEGIVELREKYGGSWWKIIGSIALSLLVGAGGAGGVGMKWLNKSRALEGALSLIVGAIESHTETAEVKGALFTAENPEIERVVTKRKSEWANEGRG